MRRIGAVLADLPLFATAPLYWRWHRDGVPEAELAAPMPGEDLLLDAPYRSTRAISIAVPPAAV